MFVIRERLNAHSVYLLYFHISCGRRDMLKKTQSVKSRKGYHHENYSPSYKTTINSDLISGRVISPSQTALPDNTQHTQETNIHAPPAIFEAAIPASERPQTHALERVASGIDLSFARIDNHPYQTSDVAFESIISNTSTVPRTVLTCISPVYTYDI